MTPDEPGREEAANGAGGGRVPPLNDNEPAYRRLAREWLDGRVREYRREHPDEPHYLKAFRAGAPQPPEPDLNGRRLVSRRDIAIGLYELQDGQAYLESTLLDPYHLIRLEIAVDPRERRITWARGELLKAPFPVCPGAGERAQDLVGLTIGRGVMRELARRVGGGAGCVHLRELASETINFAATALVGYEHGLGLLSHAFNELPPERKHELSCAILAGSCRAFPETGAAPPGLGPSPGDPS